MAADLDGQDWLDMDNIEQVKCQQHCCDVITLLMLCVGSLLSIIHTIFGSIGKEMATLSNSKGTAHQMQKSETCRTDVALCWKKMQKIKKLHEI